MISRDVQTAEDEFVKPGIISVSPAALKFARDFGMTIGRRDRAAWVVTFDWATSVTVRQDSGENPQDIGPCLMLGAYKRAEVPTGFTQTVEGFEFAVKIPTSIRAKSVHRLIDIDPALLFKLVLR
jgi:hypothetical protein